MDDLIYEGVVYDVAADDFLIVQHPMSIQPDRATIVASRSKIPASTMPLSTENSTNGDWYFDSSTSLLSYIGAYIFH